MADETTHSSSREQVVVCLHWVNDTFEVHEEFIGLHVVEFIDADTLVSMTKDVFRKVEPLTEQCQGQCCNGEATMAGLSSGVAKQLSQEEPRAIHAHCFGHTLNLACGDTIKPCKLMKYPLDTTHEITKLIKKSLRRDKG